MFKSTNCLIGLINRGNLVIFKFRNPKFDLKDNFVNNFKKLEYLQIFKFLRFNKDVFWKKISPEVLALVKTSLDQISGKNKMKSGTPYPEFQLILRIRLVRLQLPNGETFLLGHLLRSSLKIQKIFSFVLKTKTPFFRVQTYVQNLTP